MLLSVIPHFADEEDDLSHIVSIGNQMPRFRFVHKENVVTLFTMHVNLARETFKNKYSSFQLLH